LPSFVSASTSSTPVPRASSTALELPDEILDVLDDEFVNSHYGGYRCFLVRWKDRSSTMTPGSLKKNLVDLILAS